MIYDKIKPTYDRILVKRLKEDSYVTTEGGILIEDTSSKEEGDSVLKALVVAQGPEVKEDIVGSLVLVGRYSGLEVKKDSLHYLINIKDILATL